MNAEKTADFEICSPSRLLGVEIKGIDASQPLPQTTLSFLLDSLNRYSVIYLRNQKLSDPQLAEFCRRFGTLKISNLGRYLVPEFPELNIVSNIQENGQYIGNPDAGVFWHSDSAYTDTPDMHTFLYSLEVPVKDSKPFGATSFASIVAAYDALPNEFKSRLMGLNAIQDARHQDNKKKSVGLHRRGDITTHQEKVGLAMVHPVVRTHPITLKKSLFVSEGHTSGIVGIPQQESEEILTYLNAHITLPEFTYRHEWAVGDMLIWDNCAVLHRAEFDYALPQRRLMHRASTVGTVPF